MNTQPEQWKAIAECNGQYYISNYGRVKSYKCGNERILKYALYRGYPYVHLKLNQSKDKVVSIHRLVAMYFLENPENKKTVNHRDGNKSNNHIDNLEWMTQKENVQHAWQNGLCEKQRLAVGKAKSKPVIDIITGTKYNSLKLACEQIQENYSTHAGRILNKRKSQRFFYINYNGNG
jgi:hypothetical protein